METISPSRPLAQRDADGAYIQAGYERLDGDFSDPRVFLTSPGDPNVAVLYPDPYEATGAWQACDGPTYLVVGPSAADDKLERLSKRYGVPLADMMAFRARQAKIDEANSG